MLGRGVLHAPDEHVERACDRVGPLGLDQQVDATELDEGDGRRAMLGLDRSRRDVCPDLFRDEPLEREPGERKQRRGARSRPRRCTKQHSLALCGSERPRLESLGCRIAEQDLAGLGGRLHLHGPRRAWAGDDQLAMRLADDEEVEGAAVDPNVHLQRHGACARLRAAELAERLTHPEGRRRRPARVLLPVEEEQERVAAELDQSTAEVVGHIEQTGESRVHHLRHLLRSNPAESRQPLRHLREAGDVDEGHRPVELPPERVGRFEQPFDRDAWDIRGEPLLPVHRYRRRIRHSSIVARIDLLRKED